MRGSSTRGSSSNGSAMGGILIVVVALGAVLLVIGASSQLAGENGGSPATPNGAGVSPAVTTGTPTPTGESTATPVPAATSTATSPPTPTRAATSSPTVGPTATPVPVPGSNLGEYAPFVDSMLRHVLSESEVPIRVNAVAIYRSRLAFAVNLTDDDVSERRRTRQITVLATSYAEAYEAYEQGEVAGERPYQLAVFESSLSVDHRPKLWYVNETVAGEYVSGNITRSVYLQVFEESESRQVPTIRRWVRANVASQRNYTYRPDGTVTKGRADPDGDGFVTPSDEGTPTSTQEGARTTAASLASGPLPIAPVAFLAWRVGTGG